MVGGGGGGGAGVERPSVGNGRLDFRSEEINNGPQKWRGAPTLPCRVQNRLTTLNISRYIYGVRPAVVVTRCGQASFGQRTFA